MARTFPGLQQDERAKSLGKAIGRGDPPFRVSCGVGIGIAPARAHGVNAILTNISPVSLQGDTLVRRLDLGLLVATVATVATGAVNANADELRGRFVRVGVARVSPDPNHVVASLNGVPVPGASFNAETEYGIAAEVGIYLFNSPVSLSLSVTSPVTTANIGTGAFAATPELGADSFMLGALTANYHFNREGRISPYFGGGLGYFYPTGSLDGVVTDLHIGGAYGSVLQAGADFNATDSWGAFVDVKQFRIDIDATGIAFGESLVANAAIDPLVVSLGMSHRF